jgi:hypothetical protein
MTIPRGTEERFERTTEFFGTSGKKMNFEECVVGEEFLYNILVKNVVQNYKRKRVSNPESFLFAHSCITIQNPVLQKNCFTNYMKNNKEKV